MSFSKVRAIFFDAVGTLIHPDPPAPVVYERVGKQLGSDYDAAVIKSRFAQAFDHEEQIDRQWGWRTSEEREMERWQYIVSHVLNDVSDSRECFQTLFDHFSRPDAWKCDPTAGNILNRLAKEGVVLGMASNYDSRIRSVVAGKPELAPIQHLCISSEIGWRKPSPKFFSALCQLVEIPAEQILFVGDDPVNDIEGAISAGIPAMLFDPNVRDDKGKIRGLQALLRLVDS
jgi:putative hydrolase of the HAD superfamily